MFGNTAFYSFSERGFFFLLVFLACGGVVLSTADRGRSQTLAGVNPPTRHHSAPSFSASARPYPASDFRANNSHADTVRAVNLSPKPLPREAAAGHPLYYTFTVTNLGNVEDQYTLAVTGNLWPLTLLSADSTAKISSTGIIAAGENFQLVAKLDVPSNAAIGAIDTARIVARSVTAPSVSDFAKISTISLGPAAPLPWIESFPRLSKKTTPWQYTEHFPYNVGPAEVDTAALNEPSPLFSLQLDGDALRGDEVRSQPIDLSGKRDAVLQFSLEKCSVGETCQPENGDDFFVDYFNNDGEWINLRMFPGGEPYLPTFSIESIILPADAYHSSFRFRFRNLASLGPFDEWYVDDINIFEVTPTKIPFVETFAAPALSARKWPVSTGVRIDTLGRNEPSLPFSAHLQGNSLLQTQPIDLSGESAVSARYFFQQTGLGEEPDIGDDLLVEFRDAQGNWILLAQHPGAAGGLPAYTRNEAILPPAAYYRDFRLRFRAIGDAGSDDWLVDDVIIDVFLPPEIDITPTAIATTLFVGDSTSRDLVIRNAGPGELFYRIRFAPPFVSAISNGQIGSISSDRAADRGVFSVIKYPQSFYQTGLGKKDYDWREGRRVVLNRGGPDNFGYTWRDSREPDGPVFQWIDIASTGARIPDVRDDDNVGPFDIGFAFPFYDFVFATFRFCTNGFISFASRFSSFINNPIPAIGISDLVAPFWDDLDLTASMAHYQTDGKRLIVQWTNAVRPDGGGPYTFQLILTPEGNIIFQYLEMGAPTNFSTVGIQNHDGSDGLEIAFNTLYVQDSLAVRLERPASWLSFSSRSGMVAAGASATVQMKLKAAGLAPDSTYRTELRVESNDVDEPIVPVQIVLEVLARIDTTKHFHFDTTSVRYVINIDAATLNGQPLDAGDEIGVFTPAGLTAGATIWTGAGPARLIAYGDDSLTTAIDGFKRGETMFFRIWDRTVDRDYPATATYSQGDGRFGTGDSARIALLAAQTHFTREYTLNRGWSWISFNVMPDDPNVANVMAGVANLAIMSNDEGEFYIPGQINGIGDLDVLAGYKVYLNAPDSIKVTGQEVSPATPMPLRETWNFVSFLPVAPINAEIAMASISRQLVIAKNDAGGFFIPQLINTLGKMQPGRGYRLYMNTAGTLIYPFGGASIAKFATSNIARLPVSAPLSPKHFAPIAPTAESYSLMILAASVNGKPLRFGDEIGVFTPSRRLAGAGVWPESGILGIPVWQEENLANQSRTPAGAAGRRGFLPGEKMTFRVWRSGGFDGQTNAEEITASAKYLRGDGIFGTAVYSILELEANSLPRRFQLRQNYPNPFLLDGRTANGATAHTLIRYELPQPGFVELRIYNVLGQVVRVLKQEQQPAGYHQVLWDGRDEQGRLVAGGVYLYRLQVNSGRQETELVAVRKVVVVP